MKSQKGITLTSLAIYIMVVLIVVRYTCYNYSTFNKQFERSK